MKNKCQYYDENALVCNDGDCGCYECYIRIEKLNHRKANNMTDNLFDNAKFGDMFLTTEKKQAVFLRLSENAENKFAILYVEDWGTVQVFRHNGNEVNGDIAHSIIKKQEEPVSEDLEKEIIRYIGFPQEVDEDVSTTMIRKAAHHFANWQKEQLEKERKK